MRVSFNLLGTAVATLGCAFLIQSCAEVAPVDSDGFSVVSAYESPSEEAKGAAYLTGQQFAGKSVTVSAQSLVLNGGFESNGGDNSSTFTDWTVWNQAGGSGNFFAESGTSVPLSGHTIPSAPEGSFVAVSAQTGPGSHIIYQDVAIPPQGAQLSFELFIGNRAGVWYHPTTLSYNSGANQQFRMDIMDPTAAVNDYGAGILQNVYTTAAGDPFVMSGYTTVTASLDGHAGQTIRLRFAEVDNQSYFNAGIDNVCVIPNDIPVDLDVKPGSSTNPVNIGAGGKIPVAILGSDDLDVTTIDVTSILLGDGSSTGTGIAVKNNGSLHYSIEDVDGDGDMDLMMHFSVSAMVANGDLSSTSTSLIVSGVNDDGYNITGEDDITIVP